MYVTNEKDMEKYHEMAQLAAKDDIKKGVLRKGRVTVKHLNSGLGNREPEHFRLYDEDLCDFYNNVCYELESEASNAAERINWG